MRSGRGTLGSSCRLDPEFKGRQRFCTIEEAVPRYQNSEKTSVVHAAEVFCISGRFPIKWGMALFTIIADHEDGASSFSQVDAGSVRQALIRWAEKLESPPWENFSSEQREDILEQIDDDTDDEDLASNIQGCRHLWRQDYLLDPGGKMLRVLIIRTADL